MEFATTTIFNGSFSGTQIVDASSVVGANEAFLWLRVLNDGSTNNVSLRFGTNGDPVNDPLGEFDAGPRSFLDFDIDEVENVGVRTDADGLFYIRSGGGSTGTMKVDIMAYAVETTPGGITQDDFNDMLSISMDVTNLILGFFFFIALFFGMLFLFKKK